MHYRWHALYGRRVRRFYGERRSGVDVVVVEEEPGAAFVVAAWMLDPAACVGMEIGAPRVCLEALIDLRRQLIELGLRRSFLDDTQVVQEADNEQRVTADYKVQAATSALHGAGFATAAGDKRPRAWRDTHPAGPSPDGGRRRGGRGEQR